MKKQREFAVAELTSKGWATGGNRLGLDEVRNSSQKNPSHCCEGRLNER
jgi:hypothetical protein